MRTRRWVAGCLLGLAVCTAALAIRPALAADKLSVGVLRFVSSAGLFLAQERGYFKQEGLEVNLVFFEAAQPIAVAVASGDIQFGVTAITGGTLNLAGKGALKMVAAQGAERRGFKGNALLVSAAAYARGITSLDKLAGTSVAITQVGSSHHYMIGQIAIAHKLDLASIALKPLQGIPNMVAALRSGQVDASLMTPQFARPLLEAGEAKQLAWFSDVADYQYGAVFAAPKLVSGTPDMVQRFVRAYGRGTAAYAQAFLRTSPDGNAIVDDDTRAAAVQLATYIYPNDAADKAVANIMAAVVYVEASAKLDPADIERQIAWFKKEKLVADGVDAKAFVDTSFAR
jgi:NitT/TauT family transport system substrate-binding protein